MKARVSKWRNGYAAVYKQDKLDSVELCSCICNGRILLQPLVTYPSDLLQGSPGRMGEGEVLDVWF